MIRTYVVADFLTERNKSKINDVCAGYGYDAVYYDSVEEADGNVSDGEVLYCTGGRLLHQMKNIKWCHSASAGVDGFLRTGVFDSGKVILTNSSGAYDRAISEHIIMVTLMLMRRMPEYSRRLAGREWKAELSVRSVADSSIAIVGTGNIGSAAAQKFRALGAKRLIGFNRSGRCPEAFDQVYDISEFAEHMDGIDVVVMCIPGTAETAGIMDADKISAIPRNAYFINVGRGTTVRQDALVQALSEGRIAGAALDVVDPEPLPADHPLWTAENCILTPHCSGDMGLEYTVDVTVDLFCENLRRYAGGEKMIKLVDPSKGY